MPMKMAPNLFGEVIGFVSSIKFLGDIGSKSGASRRRVVLGCIPGQITSNCF
jgi:hypothetical protein